MRILHNDSTENYWVIYVHDDNSQSHDREDDIETGESEASIDTYGLTQPSYPGNINIPLVPFIPWIPAEPAEPLNPEISDDKLPKVNPDKPGIPEVNNKYSVGSSGGSFNVNNMGAGEYQIPLSCPDGGSLTPHITLCYNSQQSSYGIAGYGVSLSGLSCITRGGRNLHNNAGIVRGVSYDSSDNLLLDGKRLVLVSGEPCESGAKYCLEGDPYTEVIVHSSDTSSSTTVWFEARSPDGRKYEYGNSTDSRISFQDRTGYTRIGSWYGDREQRH